MNSSIKDLTKIILSYENVIIAGHVNPDADAVGSCLALGLFLKGIGKNVKVLLEDYNEKYNIINGSELIFKGDLEKLENGLFIALDSGDKRRLGKFTDIFDNAEKTMVIDHHISNDYYGDYNFVDAKAAATCEIIYKLLSEMGEISKEIAENIYAGIITDTGGLKHRSTTPETFDIVASLIKKGINFTEIYNEVFFVKSMIEHTIFSKIIANIEFVEGYPLAYAFIDRKTLEKVGATQKDLDGITEYINNIRGIEAALFVYELEDGNKLSFRSKNLDVSKIAKSLGGGGHVNAAGASKRGNSLEIIEMVIDLIKNEMDEHGY